MSQIVGRPMAHERKNENKDEGGGKNTVEANIKSNVKANASDNDQTFVHQPVLLDEVVQWLSVTVSIAGGVFFDLTVGGAGHLAALAQRSTPSAKLYGLDRDALAVSVATKRLSTYPQVKRIISAPFSTFSQVLRELGIETISGALLDLGVSSPQIDWAERGFSFQGDAPLDMRMDQRQTATASEMINGLGSSELLAVFWKYGEEKRSGRIARAIVEAREAQPIVTTGDLRKVISAAVGPANLTRTLARIFQALRIAVNDELGELERVLPQVIDSLALGGRVGVISYHSLEDRIVKQTFTRYSGTCICPPGMPVCACGAQKELQALSKKPIVAGAQEVQGNPRSRSAKFRIAERVAFPAGAGSVTQLGGAGE